MGRNAPFGRPPASERLRTWWDARSKAARQNVLLGVVLCALFVAIVMAAVARDKVPSTSRVIASRPQSTTTLALPTPSTVDIGNLGGPLTAADLFGLNTTSTTPAATTTPPASSPPATRPAPVATTSPPGPATTVTNPDVIFTTVVPDPTTTTRPSTTTTTRPTTTTTRPTTTTALSVPLSVPALLGP